MDQRFLSLPVSIYLSSSLLDLSAQLPVPVFVRSFVRPFVRSGLSLSAYLILLSYTLPCFSSPLSSFSTSAVPGPPLVLLVPHPTHPSGGVREKRTGSCPACTSIGLLFPRNVVPPTAYSTLSFLRLSSILAGHTGHPPHSLLPSLHTHIHATHSYMLPVRLPRCIYHIAHAPARMQPSRFAISHRQINLTDAYVRATEKNRDERQREGERLVHAPWLREHCLSIYVFVLLSFPSLSLSPSLTVSPFLCLAISLSPPLALSPTSRPSFPLFFSTLHFYFDKDPRGVNANFHVK